MDQLTNPAHDLHGFFFEDLAIGTTSEFAKTISEADIQLFADVSGDINPVHLNAEFAGTTMFKGCIAHGILTASFISTVIGTQMPGPGCIYVSQNLKFKAPVRAGDTVRAVCTITELNEKRKFVELQTQCFVGDLMVIDGNATIMVPSRG
ncbi:MAG: MaoC family dehydratase [Rhodospirillales bacterium]|nr:MaoC family dehydratase [Rhodospirillales bacterium]